MHTTGRPAPVHDANRRRPSRPSTTAHELLVPITLELSPIRRLVIVDVADDPIYRTLEPQLLEGAGGVGVVLLAYRHDDYVELYAPSEFDVGPSGYDGLGKGLAGLHRGGREGRRSGAQRPSTAAAPRWPPLLDGPLRPRCLGVSAQPRQHPGSEPGAGAPRLWTAYPWRGDRRDRQWIRHRSRSGRSRRAHVRCAARPTAAGPSITAGRCPPVGLDPAAGRPRHRAAGTLRAHPRRRPSRPRYRGLRAVADTAASSAARAAVSPASLSPVADDLPLAGHVGPRRHPGAPLDIAMDTDHGVVSTDLQRRMSPT